MDPAIEGLVSGTDKNSGEWAGGSAGQMLLYSHEDELWLSEPLCIVRAQIEAFAATQEDVVARRRRNPPTVGRVGIRCIHCKHIPLQQRTKGAVTYPNSIRLVHQAVRNFQRYHFFSCPQISDASKEKVRSFKAKCAQSKKDSKDYWYESCVRMGMVDADDEKDGIRFGSDASTRNDSADNDKGAVRDGAAKTAPDAAAKTLPDAEKSAPEGGGETTNRTDTTLLDEAPVVRSAQEDVIDTKEENKVETSGKSLEHKAIDLDPLIEGPLMEDGIASLDNIMSLGIQDDFDLGFQHTTNDGAQTQDSLVTGALDGSDTTWPLESTIDPSLLFGLDPNAGHSDITNAQATTGGVTNSGGGGGGTESLLKSVRVALDLVRGVQEAHNAGVAYTGNIGVGNNNHFLSDDRIRSDLVTLGSVLYQHFSGVSPFHADTIGNDSGDLSEAGAAVGNLSISETTRPTKKKERRHTHRSYIPLRDIGFPVSLCILVSSLMDAQDSDAVDRFETASAAEEDLRLMTVEPHRYLFDADSDKLRGKLEFPEGRLVGRDHHFSNLMGAFDRVMSSGPGGAREMVLVSGYAGTGKSTLVEQLRNPLAKKNGNFVSGKFDELGQVQPLSVIFSAFNEYCNDLVGGDEDKLAEISMAVKDALGSHSNVLTDSLPNLGKILGESVSSPLHVEGSQALNRFIFYFRLFVRAVASPSHPIVVFIDDLQWADKSSLEFMTMLVSDTEISSLLFVGCYRDNEVGLNHALNAEIEKITAAGVGVLSIKLENIGQESVNALVSDTLHLSPRVTRSLGDIVFTKTNGNPLFAEEFLRSLCNENLLQYSAHSRRWEWDVDAIQSKDIADNVVELMTKKMLKLDPGVQWLLKVAACLGSRSDASTLKLLGLDTPSEGSGVPSFLDIAVSEGLLCKVGTVYKFSHDQIQEAAYSLIPSSERETMHLSIGRLLWSKASSEELKNVIFIVVDQLHRGSELITDNEEKVKAAGLFLMAGEKAMASSSFVPASLYLLQGTVFLDESDWEHNYELSLQLFTLCAEAQCATGAYEGVSITSSPILAHGRCLQDKLRAYYTLLHSLGSQGKIQDTIKNGLKVLAQLGEPFPEEAGRDMIMKDFAKTQAMLKNTPFDEILAKGVMLDPNKIAVMMLLNILTRYTYQANQQLMSLIVFRMVQVTLCHGLCRESSLAFASHGFMLCRFGHLEQGHRYGKLSLSVLKKFKANECLARVYCSLYANICVEPMQAALASISYGIEIGMSTGDIEWSLSLAVIYAIYGIQCGSKLEPLAVEVRKYLQQMKQHNHHMHAQSLPLLQAILNLIASPEDPSKLTGEAMDQEDMMSNALENQQMHFVNMVYFLRMWLAYLFGQYNIAAEMADCCRIMRKSRPFKGAKEASETFYAGLVAVTMLRGGNESDEWRSDANESMEKIKAWAENSSWNFQHKLHLLNAEMAYLNGNLEAAGKAYDEAIRVAGLHGFVHEQALACERAGIFYSEAISTTMSTDYFEQAHKYYLQWGAKRKAADLLPLVGTTPMSQVGTPGTPPISRVGTPGTPPMSRVGSPNPLKRVGSPPI